MGWRPLIRYVAVERKVDQWGTGRVHVTRRNRNAGIQAEADGSDTSALKRIKRTSDFPYVADPHPLQRLASGRSASFPGNLLRHEVERDLRERSVLLDANVVKPLPIPFATGEDRLAKIVVTTQSWIEDSWRQDKARWSDLRWLDPSPVRRLKERFD